MAIDLTRGTLSDLCDRRLLGALGFTNVYNKCEDFYALQRDSVLPDHDVLLTNPPYSADHLEKISRHVAASGKPWLLLVPNFCYMKEWWRSATRRVQQVPSRSVPPFFIAPHERYMYRAPNGVAAANGAVRKSSESIQTSPFVTFWHCGGFGAQTEDMTRAWSVSEAANGCTLAHSAAAIPQKAMDWRDPNRKKLSATQAKAARKKVPKSGEALCGTCGQIWGNCRHTKDHAPPNPSA
jgi:hypothetical protein